MSGVNFAEELAGVVAAGVGGFFAAPEASAGPLIVRRYGSVTRLTLNRPRAINALNRELLLALQAALESALTDGTRLVWLDGVGERGFCGGGDIKEISACKDPAWFRTEYSVDAFLAEYPLPVVGLQHGITMGGGIGLTGHLRYRIVTETSRLAMPEVKIGIMPDVGGNLLLARAPQRLGEFYALTGWEMGAHDAIALGFSDMFVPQEKVPALFAYLCAWVSCEGGEMDQETLQKILESPADQGIAGRDLASTRRGSSEIPESLAQVLSLFSECAPGSTSRLPVAGGVAEFGEWWMECVREVPEVLPAGAADAAAAACAGVAELVEALRREGSAQALKIIEIVGAACPRSVLVAFAQVLRTRSERLSLREVLDDDFRVLLRLGSGADFAEGVRAQVIDKDKNPRWQEQNVSDVNPGVVAEIIAAYSDAEPKLWHS